MTEAAAMEAKADPLLLPLDSWHREKGGRMVEFAGYAMPIQYSAEVGGGIMAEHEWTRTSASLFDVSHMGQLTVAGPGAGAALEKLLPADLGALKECRTRYSLLLAGDGGILDDLLITRTGEDSFRLVVNGATTHDDIAYLRAHLPEEVTLAYHREMALIALQGPLAASVLDDLMPGIADALPFMASASRGCSGTHLIVCRSGYTGEDGFEIAVPAEKAIKLADALLADARVKPAGLGARDSLRLEAGLPLYGHDMTASTDPVSADLSFAISKRRREEGGFAGADTILPLLAEGAPSKRVGLAIEGRAPAREGATIMVGGRVVGVVTSGGHSPTLGRPVAMGQVEASLTAPGTQLEIDVRGRKLAATVAPLPFVPHNYRRQGGK
ncbi:MAG: glycine cleavage system protein T [Sphingomonadales bacterium 32-64-17]|nr:MAG: glycine cleavage system protein T [Sphingomonadales bacterium 32-64-17]